MDNWGVGKGDIAMREMVWIGQERQIVEIPRLEWERGLAGKKKDIEARIAFMTEDHHRVRNFVVMKIPDQGKPLSPEFINRQLNMPLAKVNSILGDLERNLTFLVRNEKGEVVWAYPVTVDQTPHQVTLNTGEQFYAA